MADQSDLPIGVIGGGPKAAAIAAKSRVLRDCGHKAPEVVVVEMNDVGAHWNGYHGFTTGTQRLGTPPEKDVGFPYSIDSVDPVATRMIFRDYSWISYQIQQQRFSEWVDRGRPHPTHKQWAKYLSWVINRSKTRVVKGRVTSVIREDDTWKILTNKGDQIVCQGVVFTGPGPAKTFPFSVPNDELVMLGDNFWSRRHLASQLHDEGYDSNPIVVIGGGETAASIIMYLIDNISPKFPIVVLTRSGALFTRGEGYYENRMFTDAETWRSLPETVREDVIRRADRGVFSVDVIKAISQAHNVEHRFFAVRSINKIDHSLFRINDEIDCQMVVLALGFDPSWFTTILDEDTKKRLPDDLPRSINHDLSINIDGIRPKIYAPMLAGLEQGPGFPNLSCLGTLSDRILGRVPTPEGDAE